MKKRNQQTVKFSQGQDGLCNSVEPIPCQKMILLFHNPNKKKSVTTGKGNIGNHFYKNNNAFIKILKIRKTKNIFENRKKRLFPNLKSIFMGPTDVIQEQHLFPS